MSTKKRRKRCKDCGELKDDVLGGLCEDCEQDYVWCAVCQEMIHIDQALYRDRHLFWSNTHGNWYGTGADDFDKETTKQSLFTVFRKTGIAEPLRDTIKRGKMGFETIHFYGSMFGYDGLVCYLSKDSDDRDIDYGPKFTAGLTETEEEDLSIGVAWLIGLENEKTQKQNELTLKWIDEFLQLNT